MWTKTKTSLTQPYALATPDKSNRRRFIKNASILAPVLMLRPSYLASNKHQVRIGIIGAGAWGQQYLSLALQHQQIAVVAICDIQSPASQLSKKASYYSSYKELLQRADIDAVIIATPWQQHYPVAKAALLAGKHVACGPIMGVTVEEHLDIVSTSRQTGKQYFTLDEYSYRPDLLAVAQMVNKGLFGQVETIHAGVCYQSLAGTAPSVYPVYPALATANMIDLQNNRYVSVRAMQQQQEYIVSRHAQSGARQLKVMQGTSNTIALTTGSGQTIYLQSSKHEAQPHTTGFKIKGSTAQWMDFTHSIYINNNWQADSPYLQQYTHPIYQSGINSYQQPPACEGMALALHHFLQVVQQPVNGHLTVYTAAANSIIAPLAQLSLQNGGQEIAFPNLSQTNTSIINHS